MRYFLDTEFYDDGRTIDLISVGIVSTMGTEFYAENVDFDWSRVNQPDNFLEEQVRPHLLGGCHAGTGDVVRDRLRDYFAKSGSGSPEFWGYVPAYDWVALVQLMWGSLVEKPANWPSGCNDLKQLARLVGFDKTKYPLNLGPLHRAIDDARWNRKLFDALRVACGSVVRV